MEYGARPRIAYPDALHPEIWASAMHLAFIQFSHAPSQENLMSKPNIGIVIGTTRQGRFSEKPAAWIQSIAAKREDLNCLVTIELQLAPVRNAVHIGMIEFLGVWQQGKSLDDFPHLAQSATAMLDDLAWWATALKNARTAS
jgi:hypothetical protein